MTRVIIAQLPVSNNIAELLGLAQEREKETQERGRETQKREMYTQERGGRPRREVDLGEREGDRR